MNGWQRLWVVACLCWAVVVGWQAWLFYGLLDDSAPMDLIQTAGLFWLLPCLGIYAIGYGIAWALRGFQTTAQSPSKR